MAAHETDEVAAGSVVEANPVPEKDRNDVDIDFVGQPEPQQLTIDLNERLGEARMAAAEHRNLAYVELHDGNLERARALVGEARARRAGLDYPALDAYLALDDATLAAADGDSQAAQEHLRLAMQLFDDLGVQRTADILARMGAEQAFQHGSLDFARTWD